MLRDTDVSLREHDDVYASLACVARLLAHGAPAVVDEIATTLSQLRQQDPRELIDLLPVSPSIALIRAAPAELFSKVERQMSLSVLISAHAFFESVIQDLLRVTMLCNRELVGRSCGQKRCVRRH